MSKFTQKALLLFAFSAGALSLLVWLGTSMPSKAVANRTGPGWTCVGEIFDGPKTAVILVKMIVLPTLKHTAAPFV